MANKDGSVGVKSSNTICYPLDLLAAADSQSTVAGGTNYGNQFVMFFINIQSNANVELNKFTSYAGMAFDQTQNGQPVVPGKNDPRINKFAKSEDTSKDRMIGVDARSIDLGAQTKRLEQTIALYVPHALQVNYGSQWDSDDIGEAVKAGMGLINLEGAQLADQGVRSLIKLAESATGADIQNAADLKTRKMYNAKKQQLFRGVDFRTFTFNYMFNPKNSTETNAVQNIIRLFKFHMLPEYESTSAMSQFIYPSEFDIEYYINGSLNPHLHRHASCVLTNMSIDYTPNGQYSTFSDGMPTHIGMQLTFRELNIVTKEGVNQGY